MKSLFLLLILFLVSSENSIRKVDLTQFDFSSTFLSVSQKSINEQRFYFSNPDSISIKNKEDEAAKYRIKNSFEELYHVLNPFE